MAVAGLEAENGVHPREGSVRAEEVVVVVADPAGARGNPDDEVSNGHLDGLRFAAVDEHAHRQAIVPDHVEAQETSNPQSSRSQLKFAS